MIFMPDTRCCSKLYFLRHAIATLRGDPKYKDDSLRPLTSQGRLKMRRAAQGMQTLRLNFDLICSSPYLRAKQTAGIVAQIYNIKNKTIYFTNNLLAPASIKELLREINAQFPKSENILFVGHEPHLSQMISGLLNSSHPLSINFKKGGLCCLEIQADEKKPHAVFQWLLTPTQLALMAKEK